MSRIRNGLARTTAVALGGASLLLFALPAHAAPADDPVYSHLQNVRTLKCLGVPLSSTANGVATVQWTCGTVDDQSWALEPVPGGSSDQYTVHNLHSGKCLAIGAGDPTNGVNAVQWTCDSGNEQVWTYDSTQRLRNLATGKCLAVPNSSPANGVAMVQWPCSVNTDQMWMH